MQNDSFPHLRANENGIINIGLELFSRHQPTSPMPHQSELRLPAYGVSQKNNDIGQAYFFSPPPPPFPSFALAPTLSGYYFYSPQSSSFLKSNMAATTLRTWTSFRPLKIRLHCRLFIFKIKSLYFHKIKCFLSISKRPRANYHSLWTSSVFGERVKKSRLYTLLRLEEPKL